MKDLVRQKLGINVDIMDMLNDQIAKEARSSSAYLAMASWCDHNGFANSADFFYKQSSEEREHMLKIFRFRQRQRWYCIFSRSGKRLCTISVLFRRSLKPL